VYLDGLLTAVCSAGVFYWYSVHWHEDDYIVLLAPTSQAMYSMLLTYKGYAAEVCIQFNASKSKYIIMHISTSVEIV